MARPTKHNADYFSHDANMRNQRKILAMRGKYGAKGYGIWCMLQEVLADSDYFRLELDEVELELLASDFMIEVDFLQEFLSYMQRLKLISYDSNILSCPSLTDSLQLLVDRRKRDKRRKNARSALTENLVSTSEKAVSDSENVVNDEKTKFSTRKTHSKVEQSKGKKRKVKESNNNSKERRNSIAVDAVDFEKYFSSYEEELSTWEFRGAVAHFKKQVSRNGDTNSYDSEAAVVTHFRNWYNSAVASGLFKEVLAAWNDRRLKLLKNFNKVTRMVLAARGKKYLDLDKLKSGVTNAQSLFLGIEVDRSVLRDEELEDFRSAWSDCEKFFDLFSKSTDDVLVGFLKKKASSSNRAKVTSMTAHLANKLKVS
ncbi:MAG: Lin1244/Lin1753 domain-containing protein [Bacteroidota bacterium]